MTPKNSETHKARRQPFFLALAAAMRPAQYLKNLFIFIPAFFGGVFFEPDVMAANAVVFAFFCLAASAVYIVNDVCDLSLDREHPVKKHRPVASGAITPPLAVAIAAFFASTALAGAYLFSSHTAFALIAAYMALNIAYSLRLKHIAVIDVFCIALGFVLRLFVGASMSGVVLSHWIIIMTFLMTLFLGLAKRRDDVVVSANTGNRVRKSIDGYNLDTLNAMMNVTASVTLVSYILYTVSPDVVEKYKAVSFNSDYIYTTSFFVILGIFRYLQIAYLYEKSGSPTKVLLGDRFIQLTIVAWLVHFGAIIYL